jgi:hypothetical protein
MLNEKRKEFILLFLCLLTFLDSACFNNFAGLPLDLFMDTVLLLDFCWKICKSKTYWKESNYQVLFDVALILLIVAYSVIEIQFRESFEEADDIEATLVFMRFGTRLLYSRRFYKSRCCKRSHVKVATEDYSITALREEGAIWDIVKEVEGKVCRALDIECPIVLERTACNFSFENLAASTHSTTFDMPSILWLHSDNFVIGFYRECPWNCFTCNAAPHLRVIEVVDNQYELYEEPKISFVNTDNENMVLTTDAGVYTFTESLETMRKHLVGKEACTYTMQNLELISYSKNITVHLTPL